MENLDSTVESLFDEIDKSTSQSGQQDIDALNAGHQIWMQSLSNKYEILTHKIWILILFILICAVFVFTRYKSLSNSASVVSQLNSDCKEILKTFGISFVTWIVTKHFDSKWR